jgi:hypothetical protein
MTDPKGSELLIRIDERRESLGSPGHAHTLSVASFADWPFPRS